MEDWQRNKGKKPKRFSYTYQDIADLLGLKQQTVRKHAQQGKYKPDSLGSIVEYIGSYK